MKGETIMAVYINNGKPVKLRSLIVSGEIKDGTIIDIFDSQGRFVCKGHWYEDRILAFGERIGRAHKVGSGVSVTFMLEKKNVTNRRRVMKELSEMSNKDLYAALNPKLLEKRLDMAICKWCRMVHGGKCLLMDEGSDICELAYDQWWTENWNGKKILGKTNADC